MSENITVLYKWTAKPGPFFFFGDVPEPLRQATEQMGLGAEFGAHAFGFERP